MCTGYPRELDFHLCNWRLGLQYKIISRNLGFTTLRDLTFIDWKMTDILSLNLNHVSTNWTGLKDKWVNWCINQLLIVGIATSSAFSNPNIFATQFVAFRLLWDIVVFRLVAYLLNMICLNLLLLYKIVYIWIFVYTQFYIKFSRQEHQIELFMGRDQLLKCLGFSLYPLSFFLYSLFKLQRGHFKDCPIKFLNFKHKKNSVHS